MQRTQRQCKTIPRPKFEFFKIHAIISAPMLDHWFFLVPQTFNPNVLQAGGFVFIVGCLPILSTRPWLIAETFSWKHCRYECYAQCRVGVSRHNFIWRGRRLFVVPPVWGVECWEGFLDLIIKLWLMFRSHHLVLWSLGTYGLQKYE